VTSQEDFCSFSRPVFAQPAGRAQLNAPFLLTSGKVECRGSQEFRFAQLCRWRVKRLGPLSCFNVKFPMGMAPTLETPS
jgi:hypothetical protein